jgi:hypothetical protein
VIGRVLVPTATPQIARTGEVQSRAGGLSGRIVGIRHDVLWREFDWLVEEWKDLLEDAGSEVRLWRAGNRSGEEGQRLAVERDAFIADVDVVVSGLGNCGSCTCWTVRDAAAGLNAGRPTVAVVTEAFVPLATALAANEGSPGLRLLVLPYPFDRRPESEIREIARAYFQPLLDQLGLARDAIPLHA